MERVSGAGAPVLSEHGLLDLLVEHEDEDKEIHDESADCADDVEDSAADSKQVADHEDGEDHDEDDPKNLVESGVLSVIDLSSEEEDDETEDQADDSAAEDSPVGAGDDDSTDDAEDSADDGHGTDGLDETGDDGELAGDCSNTHFVPESEQDESSDQGSETSDDVSDVVHDTAVRGGTVDNLDDGIDQAQNPDDEEHPSDDFCIVEE